MWILVFFFCFCHGEVYKGTYHFPFQTEMSVLDQSLKTEQAMGRFSCHASNQDISKATCYHENNCYKVDLATAIKDTLPSSPVTCQAEQVSHVPSSGLYS